MARVASSCCAGCRAPQDEPEARHRRRVRARVRMCPDEWMDALAIDLWDHRPRLASRRSSGRRRSTAGAPGHDGDRRVGAVEPRRARHRPRRRRGPPARRSSCGTSTSLATSCGGAWRSATDAWAGVDAHRAVVARRVVVAVRATRRRRAGAVRSGLTRSARRAILASWRRVTSSSRTDRTGGDPPLVAGRRGSPRGRLPRGRRRRRPAGRGRRRCGRRGRRRSRRRPRAPPGRSHAPGDLGAPALPPCQGRAPAEPAPDPAPAAAAPAAAAPAAARRSPRRRSPPPPPSSPPRRWPRPRRRRPRRDRAARPAGAAGAPAVRARQTAYATTVTSAGHVATEVGCAAGTSAAALDAFFRERVGPVIGHDYQHVVPARRRPLPVALPGHVRRPQRAGHAAGPGGVRPQHGHGPGRHCFTLLHRGTAGGAGVVRARHRRAVADHAGSGRWAARRERRRRAVFWAEMAKTRRARRRPTGSAGSRRGRGWRRTTPTTLARLVVPAGAGLRRRPDLRVRGGERRRAHVPVRQHVRAEPRPRGRLPQRPALGDADVPRPRAARAARRGARVPHGRRVVHRPRRGRADRRSATGPRTRCSRGTSTVSGWRSPRSTATGATSWPSTSPPTRGGRGRPCRAAARAARRRPAMNTYHAHLDAVAERRRPRRQRLAERARHGPRRLAATRPLPPAVPGRAHAGDPAARRRCDDGARHRADDRRATCVDEPDDDRGADHHVRDHHDDVVRARRPRPARPRRRVRCRRRARRRRRPRRPAGRAQISTPSPSAPVPGPSRSMTCGSSSRPARCSATSTRSCRSPPRRSGPGHHVVVATGPDLVPHVAAHGLATWAIGTTHAAAGGRAAISPEYFTATGAPSVPPTSCPRASVWRPDVVVHEEMELAGAVVAAVTGAHHVVHGLGLLPPRWVWDRFAPVVRDPRPRRRRPSRRRPGGCHLPADQPALAAARGRRPVVRRAPDPTGVRVPSPQDRLPPGLDELVRDRGDPVVHLTLGTVFHESPGVLATAIEGLARLRIRLLVTTGPGVGPGDFAAPPPNVRIVEYVPHALFLRHCDVVVSHAGAGIMFGALVHGSPQLLLPQGADQFANADACRDAGVALTLQPDEVTAEEVGLAVRRLLVSPSFWANASSPASGDRQHAVTRRGAPRAAGRRRDGGRAWRRPVSPRRRTAAAIWVTIRVSSGRVVATFNRTKPHRGATGLPSTSTTRASRRRTRPAPRAARRAGSRATPGRCPRAACTRRRAGARRAGRRGAGGCRRGSPARRRATGRRRRNAAVLAITPRVDAPCVGDGPSAGQARRSASLVRISWAHLSRAGSTPWTPTSP